MDAGRCTVAGRRRRARGQPPAHPRAARPAGATDAPGRAMSPGRERGPPSRGTAPPRRDRVPARARAAGPGCGLRDRRPAPRSARSTCSSLMRSQLRLAVGVVLLLAVTLGALPLLFAVVPGAGRRRTCSACRCLAAARLRRLPVAARARLVLRAPRRAQRARLHRPGGPRVIADERRRRSRRSLVVTVGDAGHRRLRAAGVAHHQRLLRRLAGGRPVAERVGDQRRVPVRGVVPRRRRAGARARRRHAVVPGRLDRRLPGPAGVRRRAAAPLRRLHAARLRRAAASSRCARAGSPAAGRADRRGCTWCRSSRAPG